MEMKRWCALGAPVMVLAVGLSAGTAATGAAQKKPAPKKADPKATAAMVAKGKQLVESDGCLACHKIGTKGNATYTDLSKIGANPKWKAPKLAAKIKNPKIDNPNSIMPPSKRPDKDIAAMAAYLASLK